MLGQVASLCPTFEETAELFSKVADPRPVPSAADEGFSVPHPGSMF